ncbi:MAG: aminotransferase class I/II-fold pyridoxal phosphate-dependent enzyme [Parashewanella sp.]
MNKRLEKKIDAVMQLKREKALLRQRRVISRADTEASNVSFDDQMLVNFSSNDYLGLTHEPALAEALYQAALKYGVGSGASPLVTGYSEAHQQLEQHLCELTGFEAAALFSSGFGANHGLMTALFDSSDIVLTDKLIHASIIDGVSHSGAKLKRFSHNNLEHATKQLSKHPVSALITESVFSMDGDIAPLAELSAATHDNDALFIVDDAHGFGVIGAGIGAKGVMTSTGQTVAIDILIITFGKALGCQGAAILASKKIINYVVSHCRDYIYSTALSPANAALALAASQHVLANKQLNAQLQHNIDYFQKRAYELGLAMMPSTTAIQAIVVGCSDKVMIIAERMREQGILVAAIRVPTVPKGTDRLRITLTAIHTKAQIDACLNLLANSLKASTTTKVTLC